MAFPNSGPNVSNNLQGRFDSPPTPLIFKANQSASTGDTSFHDVL